jgi:GDP-D-mannose dehydratase
VLGWRPQTTFNELVRIMLEADLWEAEVEGIAAAASTR